MICPGCAKPAPSEVIRTLGKDLPLPYYPRVRRCLACGFTGGTVEVWDSNATGTAPAPNGHRTGTAPAAEMLPVAYRQRAGSVRPLDGGVGGGLSSGSLSGSLSDPDLSPDLAASESGARARVRATRGPRRTAEYSPDFLAFWAAYPRKTGKGKAWEEWLTRKPQLDRVIAALAWQAQQPEWVKDGGKFIPHPSTWLHGSRWEDEPVKLSRAPVPERTQQIVDVMSEWMAEQRGVTR